jgi:hypothetical protein
VSKRRHGPRLARLSSANRDKARRTFDRDLANAREDRDAELEKGLIEIGHEVGYLERPTPRQAFNAELRAAARGHVVEAKGGD